MSKNSQETKTTEVREKPEVYVSPQGERYVEANELLNSQRGQDAVDAMVNLEKSIKASESSSQGNETQNRTNDPNKA